MEKMQDKQIRIGIADDHPMIIDGLQNMLPRYPHITLTGSYENAAALMEGLTTTSPDVLLLDIQLPDQTGDELVPLIVKKYPSIRILILTNFDSVLYANNMLKRGALGYLVKTASKDLLMKAIEQVYAWQPFIEEEMKKKMEQLDVKVKNAVFSKSTLTPREKEILQLITTGHTAPEIAGKLFLSLRTVVNYRTAIMLKLDVNNTALLVRKALTLGLAE